MYIYFLRNSHTATSANYSIMIGKCSQTDLIGLKVEGSLLRQVAGICACEESTDRETSGTGVLNVSF